MFVCEGLLLAWHGQVKNAKYEGNCRCEPVSGTESTAAAGYHSYYILVEYSSVL